MNNFIPLLPLIVPSFSSKGNLLIEKEGSNRCVSDNYDLLNVLDIKVSKSYLVSAYDVYYGLMPENPEDWPETDFLFVDSGGYEINGSYDLSERNKFNYKVRPWDIIKMENVYERVCNSEKFKNSCIILSCYDEYAPIEKQFENSRKLAKKFPKATINTLVKCENINDLINYIREHKIDEYNIKILGITEKELGSTLRDRIRNLILIRKTLFEQQWSGYIHIFGGLEPSLTKIYFWAGADIFDGLAWQRFWLKDNTFLYSPDKYKVNLDEFENKFVMMCKNLSFIQELCNELSANYNSRQEKILELEEFLDNELGYVQEVLNFLEV